MRIAPIVLTALAAAVALGAPAPRKIGIPVYFERNSGRYPSAVEYLSRGRGFSLFLTREEAVLTSAGKDSIRMRLSGIDRRARLRGIDETENRTSYFLGSDPTRWRTGIANFARVRENGVYPHIDLVYRAAEAELEYDFILEPGADPRRIRVHYDGAEKIGIDANGDLVLKTLSGEVRQRRPSIFQDHDGRRVEIAGGFRRLGNGDIGFTVGPYDRTKTLTIDPSLSYSTYLGGLYNDSLGDLIADSAGNLYVTGTTASPNFPVTQGAPKTACGDNGACDGSTDAFVAKLNAAGTGLVYSTYIGGNGADAAARIGIDPAGNAYVYGTTSSTDFPLTSGAINTPSSSLFLLKLNPAGNALIYSARLPPAAGGTYYYYNANATPFAVDPNGAVWLAGTANGGLAATPNAWQTTPHGVDGFALRVNPTATAIDYATYIGGSGSDSVSDIAVDSTGALCLVGQTSSTDFPVTTGAFQTIPLGGPTHGFVVKINPSVTAPVFSTYLGGAGSDYATYVKLDSHNNILVSGVASAGFPGPAPTLQTNGGNYLVKMAAAGSSILSSARVSTGPLWLDASDNVYTQSLGSVVKIDPALSNILYSTQYCLIAYYSCPGYDRYTADGPGNFYGAVTTSYPSTGTAGAFQTVSAGGNDILLQKIAGTGGTIQAFPSQLTLSNNYYTLLTATVDLWSAGTSGALPAGYSATSNAPWLEVNSGTGTAPAGPGSFSTISVSVVNPPTAASQGSVTITAPGADNSPLVIPVTYQPITGAYFYYSYYLGITTLSYTTGSGQTPASQVLYLYASDGSGFTVSSTASWLQVAGPYPYITYGVNAAVASTLAPGIYTGFIVATGTVANSPFRIPVILTVTAPAVTTDLGSLSFVQQVGLGTPPPQTLNISVTTNSTPLNAPVTITSSASWLSAPASLTAPGPISVSVNTAGFTTGTNRATLTISSAGASTQVPVTLTITNRTPLSASPASVTLTSSGSNSPGAMVTITGDPVTPIAVSTSGGSWLTATASSNTLPATLSINASALPPGEYQGTVTVTPQNAGLNTLQIPVTLQESPIIIAFPPSLTFSGGQRGDPKVSQTFNLFTSGSVPVRFSTSIFSASGLITVSPAAGTVAPGQSTPVTVTVDPSVSPFVDSGAVYITAVDSGYQSAVTLSVTLGPNLVLSQNSLSFTAQPGAPAPPARTVAVTTGSVSIPFTVKSASDSGWLSANPVSGASPGSISVAVNPAGLASGAYRGTVTVYANTATPSQTISVTLTVGPQLQASAASLSFGASGTAAPQPQSLQITNAGGSIAFAVSSSNAWLVATPGSASTPANIAISINPSGLVPGTYSGQIVVASSAALNSPLTIPVTFVLTAAQTLTVTPSTLVFNAALGGGAPAQTLAVSGAAGQPFSVAANAGWLQVSPAAGILPATVSVSAISQGVASGSYSGSITVTSPGVPSVSVPAVLSIPAPQELTAAPASLSFQANQGGAAPGAQNLVIGGVGVSSFNVISSAPSWLSVSPGNGSGFTTFGVSVNPASLGAGTYSAVVVATSSAAGIVAVPVTMTVINPPQLLTMPAAMTMLAQRGAAAPPAQTLLISSSGAQLFYNVSSNAAWLQVSQNYGSTPQSLTISVASSSLPNGTYTGAIQLTSAAAGNSPKSIAVTLTVSDQPPVSAMPNSMTIAYKVGDAAPDPVSIALASSTPRAFTVSASSRGWLFVDPDAGSTPGTLNVYANPFELPPGTYHGLVEVAWADGTAPTNVPVILNVTALPSVTADSVLNAASNRADFLSPGAMVTMYGQDLGGRP